MVEREDTALFLPEKEIARRLGVSLTRWRAIRGTLEGRGMRRRDPLLKLRYWPAVKAFFDNRHGLDTVEPEAQGWGENLDALKPRRARTPISAER